MLNEPAAVQQTGSSSDRSRTSDPRSLRTTCRNGHEYNAANTRYRTGPFGRLERRCRVCERERNRLPEYVDRHRERRRESRRRSPDAAIDWLVARMLAIDGLALLAERGDPVWSTAERTGRPLIVVDDAVADGRLTRETIVALVVEGTVTWTGPLARILRYDAETEVGLTVASFGESMSGDR